jgi:hypothetical protein
MASIPVELDELELMVELLKANEERLDPGYKASNSKHTNILSVSALTAISFEADQDYYRQLGEKFCYECGTVASITRFMACSRCQKVQYCSRECQKKAWKFHKKACSPSNS